MFLARWWSQGVGVPLAAMLVSGCSLGNINADECSSDAACAQLFGLGSACGEAGYCSEPLACTSSIECRTQFGFGATCESSQCVVAPLDARCTLSQPESLLYELPGRLGDRILLGGLFAIDTEKHRVRADATRLAVREINLNDGIGGRPLGILICNNDSDGDSANDAQETEELSTYLAGSLAVPVILGPTGSSNALTATNHLLEQQLATALISPSATSPQLTDLPDKLAGSDPVGLFWRTCPSDALQGQVLAQVISHDIDLTQAPGNLDNVAVIYQNDAYGSGLQAVFRTKFAEYNPPATVNAFPFDSAATNWDDVVGNAAVSSPDAVLLISSDAARTVNVLGAATGTSLNGLPFFFTDGSKDASVLLSSDNDPAVQALVRNSIGTAPTSPEGAVFDGFRDRLLGEFNRDASQFSFVAHSYDAAYVGAFGVIHALAVTSAFDGRHASAGFSFLSDGPSVPVGPDYWTTALSSLDGESGINITGTSGPLNFDPDTGEAPGDIEVWLACEPGTGSCTGTGTDLVFNRIYLAPADSLESS